MSSNSSGDDHDGSGVHDDVHDESRRRLKAAFKQMTISPAEHERRIELPPVVGSLSQTVGRGQTLRVDGTNVIRVPFGVRHSSRPRPARPDHWATVVLPFQLGGPLPPPPQAA